MSDMIKKQFGLQLGLYYYGVPSNKWELLGVRFGKLMVLSNLQAKYSSKLR